MVITYAFILATKIGRATLGIARVWAEPGRLCSGIISVKNNTNSVKNIILAITVVFLTPVFLNIHLPVPLKYASLHLKSKNMREKIEQSSLVKTALRSRCNIYHAPSLPNLACLLRQKKKEGTFKRLRVSRYCPNENVVVNMANCSLSSFFCDCGAYWLIWIFWFS